MRYVEYMPSQPSRPHKHTHTVFKSSSCFFSFAAVTQLLCLLLCLAAHSHSLSCLCPFCMCELRSQLPVQEGNLILSFCTCSQIPSLSQAGIVPQLMERESWGKLRWVIINQPAMETSRYSKHQGSAGRQLRNPLLLVFFGSTTVLHSQGATFDCRGSLLKAHALIHYIAATETGPFKSALTKLWIGP